MGLEINQDKTKYMKVTALERRRQLNETTVGNMKFESVENFSYLGSIINSNNLISEEINQRIINANRAFYANSKILKSRLVTQKTNIKIYKSLIRPVLTYGAESWTLTGKDAAKLRAYERKIIRRIYGGVKERDVWRIRNKKKK